MADSLDCQLQFCRGLSCSDLERILEHLEDRAVNLMMEIQIDQLKPEYRLARARHSWAAYFAEIRSDIEAECASLRRESCSL